MKEKVQLFGRFLSSMVMPNIGAFIAWGLITALFMADGWIPNESIAQLIQPMSYMLLPLLIAYTGGNAVAGMRGGVIGAIATMGVIVGADVPMFIGAMIMGPLSGWVIKKFDKLIEGKVKAGFEMLVNNFSIGIIGAILAVIALKGVTPLVNMLNALMESGVGFFVNHGLLPLTSLFIEPAKVLFLNNAINHGILSPLGMKQVEEAGKSIFFLLEANPGPGLGVLLAYCIAGKGSAKSSAPGAAISNWGRSKWCIYLPVTWSRSECTGFTGKFSGNHGIVRETFLSGSNRRYLCSSSSILYHCTSFTEVCRKRRRSGSIPEKSSADEKSLQRNQRRTGCFQRNRYSEKDCFCM